MSANNQMIHKSVMLSEVLDCLTVKKDGLYVDATFGLGGYSEKILEVGAKVVAFEMDQENKAFGENRLKKFEDNLTVVNDNFATMEVSLKKLGIEEVDGVVFDLGLSSPQVDNAERGFSFMKEARLDMRFGQNQRDSAYDLINLWGEEALVRIFREYGEERYSKKIARAIIEKRRESPIETTTELASLVAKNVPGASRMKIHPATRIFQAIRIAVNDELNVLLDALNQAVRLLKEDGILVVVSYHSLEDRIVKNFFRDSSREFVNLPNELTTTVLNPSLKILSKKPLEPTREEIEKNPRSRSAKLRFAQKIK